MEVYCPLDDLWKCCIVIVILHHMHLKHAYLSGRMEALGIDMQAIIAAGVLPPSPAVLNGNATLHCKI